jgi:ketosteroid isomerase-like protein
MLMDTEAENISVVRRYWDGCNSGDLDELLSTLTPDVVHYFLDKKFPPIRGAEHLARYWRKFKLDLDPIWTLDHVIAHDDEVVTEWSCLCTLPQGRVLTHGTEWYIMRDRRIAEVRAYFVVDETTRTGLLGFPYTERGYFEA